MASHHPNTRPEYYCDCNSDFAEGLPCGHFFCSRHIADWLLDYECCPECQSHCTYFEVFNFEGPGASQRSQGLEWSDTDRDYHEDASLSLQSFDQLHISHEHRQPPGESTHGNGTCTVCMDPTGTNGEPMRTFCGHVFCYKCLHDAVEANARCPNCRIFCNFSACLPASSPDPIADSNPNDEARALEVRMVIYESLQNVKDSEQTSCNASITQNSLLRDQSIGQPGYEGFHRLVLALHQKLYELDEEMEQIQRFVDSARRCKSLAELAVAERSLRRESSHWDGVLRTLWDRGE
jgi:hypothetical protein